MLGTASVFCLLDLKGSLSVVPKPRQKQLRTLEAILLTEQDRIQRVQLRS